MTINQIPQIGHPVTGNLRIDPTWYRFLRELDREARDSGVDFTAEIEALARKLGSPDGTIAGIPAPADPQYISAAEPLIAAGSRVSLATVTQEVSGELLGIALDAWGRVTGSRPVVGGPGVTIDGTTDPDQIEISAAGLTNPMTTAGDIITGGVAGIPERLAAGTNGHVLTLVSGAPAWAAGGGGGLRDGVTALSISSGVVNIDCALGDFFTLALTANVTSITFTNLPASGKAVSLALRATQDGTGGRTVALPTAFKATTGSDTAVQSAANARTLITLTTFDQGTRWEYTMRGVAA